MISEISFFRVNSWPEIGTMRHCFRLQLIFWLPLWLSVAMFAQSNQLSALQQLRDQVNAANGWRDHDVVAVISQRALNDTAQRLIGLEIKLSNGVVMKFTSVALELKPAAALVKLGVEVKPSNTFKSASFRLSGQLGSGAVQGGNLRLPFQLTDVAFGSEDIKSLTLLKLLLRDWLAPEKWNAVLPPLEIPLQLNPVINIPAATFEAGGEMPMTIETPTYQVNVGLTLAALAILDGRAVVALNVQPQAALPPQPANNSPANNSNEDEATLTNEIAHLTQHLALNQDLRVRVRKNAINDLLAKFAAARALDLTIKLKPGRLRAEEIDALIGKILNYSDVESGAGYADVARLVVENISATQMFVRVTGQGELNARVKGREYGVPYSLSPRGRFVINNELLPLQILTRNDRIMIRAEAGAAIPVRVNMTIDVIGHPIGLTRTIKLRADEWLKEFELPAMLTQEVQLPRQLVLDKNNALTIVRSETSHYTIANLRIEMKEETLEILADIK